MTDPGPGHLVERAALLSRNHQLLADPADMLVANPAQDAPAPVREPPAPPPAMPVRTQAAVPAPLPSAATPAPLPPAAPLAPSPAPQPEPAAPIPLEVLQRAGLAVAGATRSRVIEEWRVIAATLLRGQPRRVAGLAMSNALMVTSSQAREGKSFCALNLAATVAINRKLPTVLVDVDAKRDAISDLLGLSDRPGLLDLVAQPTLALESLLVPTALPHLCILPLGSHTGTASDAGITQPVTAMLERIARRLPDTLLVLDTAPCLATSDASTLSPFVGQIAIIVEAEITQKVDLEATLGLVSSCQTVSLVLNKARGQSSGHFGTGYFGYYDQGS